MSESTENGEGTGSAAGAIGAAADPGGSGSIRGALVASFVAMFTATVAMVAPAALNGDIQSRLHASGSQLSWVTAIFFIPTAALELTFGVVGDLIGRKRLLVAGSVVLVVGDGIGALAGSMPVLLTAQAVAGLGAAILFPTSLAAVAHLTPDPRERAKGIAMWSMALALGAAAGPTISGAIALHNSFRWAYGAVFLLGIASVIISILLARDSRAPEGRGLDLPGQILFAVSLTAILFGVIQGSNTSYSSPRIIACLAGGTALMIAFIVVEFHVRYSLINIELFRDRNYSGAVLVGLLSAIGFFGFNYGVSIRISVIQGQDSLVVGLASTIQAAVPLVLWPVLGRFLFRVPARWVAVLGLAAVAIAEFWAASVPISDRSLLPLVPALLLGGFGIVAAVSSTSASAVDVPKEKEGMASGTINMARDTGAAAGVAAIGAIALAHASSALPGELAKSGLSGQALAVVNHVAAAGGPVAVAHAPLGPISALAGPAAQNALWHGYSLGIVVAGCLTSVSIILTLVMIRPKRPEKSRAANGAQIPAPTLPADA
jgi:MFS family permease